RTKVLIHVVDVAGSEGRDPIEDFEKINKELASYSERIAKKPQIVAANKIDIVDEDDPGYLAFKAHVEAKGYKVFPISAPINLGVDALITEAAAALERLDAEPEEEIEVFDFERDDADPDFRKVYASRQGNVYTLSGKQLLKIFNSTNFNDMGSLRYLYKYIEKSGGLEQLKELGLAEGDIIKIEDFEFEYFDEY
ncbi:MAG: Obg family GTPase CgtA, partial [Anaerovoracaceae bacterium]